MKNLETIIKGAFDYEDGTVGVDKCIEAYCRDHGISEQMCEAAQAKAFEDGALSAGIPLSVVKGKTQLTDHFSQQYIEFKANKK